MAGEWIKMRKALTADSKVVRISSALKADRLRAIGALFCAWSLLDDQTEDGRLEGYTPEIFDEMTGCPGLAKAMASVDWLEIGDGFIAAPRFEEHNGATAKRRAQEAVRKASARSADKTPQTKRTSDRNPSGQKEDQRREEKSSTPTVPKGDADAVQEAPPDDDWNEDDEVCRVIWEGHPQPARRRSSREQVAKAWKAVPKSERIPYDDIVDSLALWRLCRDWTRDEGEGVGGVHLWIQRRKWTVTPPAPQPAGRVGDIGSIEGEVKSTEIGRI